jgi:hypothetical protein
VSWLVTNDFQRLQVQHQLEGVQVCSQQAELEEASMHLPDAVRHVRVEYLAA